MSFEDSVREVIGHAESELHDLLQQALEAGDYRAVSRIAETADAIATALADIQRVPPRAAPVTSATPTTVASASRPADGGTAAPNQTRRAYPRFERDGDKLIKVGWSKKDRREYEHRAPKEAVVTTVSRMAEQAGSLFTMEDVLPVKIDDGSDAPTYQVYLALAWFRDLGLVQKKGKDGYTINGSFDWDTVESFWQGLDAR